MIVTGGITHKRFSYALYYTGPFSAYRELAAASNLDIKDFSCRFLVVDDIWISLAESLLIERFQPVWNRVLDGLGNHDPGKGRYNGMMPQWDCLHPGRKWAERLQPCPNTAEQLEQRVVEYLHNAVSVKHILT